VTVELPENFGSIILYCSEESAALATREVLAGIGECLATALKNAREHNRVKELSIRDGLTGLYNRRVLEEILHLEESKRVQSPVSILLMDVDDFKMINDTFGHQAGDLALSMIGKVLMDNSRKENIVARYGGEEFAVLLTNTRLDTALKVAERMRIKLGEQEFSFSGNRFKLSVSIGVAANDGLTLDPQGLIARADQALYQAKRSGKNRVCSQETLPPLTMSEKRRRPHPRFEVNCF
jgi:diguanylate cyclase (GGDEF)-like protein